MSREGGRAVTDTGNAVFVNSFLRDGGKAGSLKRCGDLWQKHYALHAAGAQHIRQNQGDFLEGKI